MRIKNTILLLLSLSLAACATEERHSSYAPQSVYNGVAKGTFKIGKPYQVFGKWYTPEEDYSLVETGIASWYGPNFHGKQTANGEIFDQNELTAAHRTLHMPSIVRVTNLENGRSLVVRVNDRGPFKRGRIIDLSKRAAELLGFKTKGTAKVRIQVLPEESRKIAEIAKNGHSTQGMEVAMNNKDIKPTLQKTSSPQQQPAHPPKQTSRHAALKPVDKIALDTPVHTKHGNLYPDPIVKTVPVPDTGIFVQAASFGSKDNAMRFAQKLSTIGDTKVISAVVNGQTMHRVRFGPMKDVAQADAVLAKLIQSGNGNGLIIVE